MLTPKFAISKKSLLRLVFVLGFLFALNLFQSVGPVAQAQVTPPPDPPKQEHRLGAKPLPRPKRTLQPTTFNIRPNLPAKVDYSSYLPPVGDQGIQNSCVAWANGYYYKSFQDKLLYNWSLTTTNHQFSPAFIYNQINDGVDKGAYIPDAFNLMLNEGADTLASSVYNDQDYTTQPTVNQLANAANYKASTYITLYNGNNTVGNSANAPIDLFREHLADGDIFTISIPVYNEFYNATNDYNYVFHHSISDPTSPDGYHALAIVGYDDSKQAFRIVNSWGAEWGNGGFTWLGYDFVRDFVWGAYSMTDRNQLSFTAYPTSTPSNTANSAIVSFVTNRPTTAVITLNGTTLTTDNTLSTNHTVSVSNLPVGAKDLIVTVHDSGTATALAGLNIPAINAPSNLAVAAVSNNQIRLTWNDNSNNEDGFKIERSPNGTDGWTVVGTTGAGVTYFQSSGLNATTTYYYRVWAYNSQGASTYSNQVSGQTSGGTGSTWLTLFSNINADLENISCYTGSTCYAGTADGRLLYTTNGGSTWSFITNLPGRSLGLSCPYLTICFATSFNGNIYYTTNSGVSWTTRNTGVSQTLRAISCINPYMCTAVGDSGAIVRTVNGGTSWSVQIAPVSRSWTSVSCPSSTTCYVGGDGPTLIGTTNQGSNWTNFSLGLLSGAHSVSALSCSNTQTCMATTDNTQVLATSNGGTSWQTQTPGLNLMLGLSCAPNSSNCYIVNGSGQIVATGNGGQTWGSETSGTVNPLFAVSCPASDACFAVGYGGVALYRGTIPNAPSNMVVGAVAEHQLTFQWTDNSFNEGSFKVYKWNGYTGTFDYLTSVSADVASFTDTGLACSSDYYYQVSAYNGAGESAPAPWIKLTTNTCTPPVAPSNLVVTTTTSSHINMNWQDNSTNEDNFPIEMRLGSDSTWYEIGTAPGNTTGVGVEGLNSNTSYCFRVRAVNSDGYSGYTNEGCATTLPININAPSNLTIAAINDNSVNLHWADNSNNEDGFSIEYSQEVWVSLGSVGANTTSATVTNLASGTNYCFRVQTINSQGKSAYSNLVCASTTGIPGAPANLSQIGRTKTSSSLSWQDNSGNESGFKIYKWSYQNNRWDFYYLATVGTNITNYFDNNLNCGSTYFYTVSAFNSQGESSRASWIAAATSGCLDAPTNLSATLNSNNRWVNLSWNNPASDAQGFYIIRASNFYGPWFVAGTVGGNNLPTTFTDRSAGPGLNYYAVYSFNSQGNSNWSNQVTLNLPNINAFTDLTINGSPYNATVANAGDDKWYRFTVSTPTTYTIATTGGTLSNTYVNLYGSDNFNEVAQDDDCADGPAARVAAPLSNGVYYVRVRAYNETAIGTYSIKVVNGEPPAAPDSLSAMAVSTSQINLSWRSNSYNESGFRIEQYTDATGWLLVANVGSGVTSYQHTNLQSSIVYTYQVRAYNALGNSYPSGSASTRTYDSNGTSLIVTNPIDRGMQLDGDNSGTLAYALKHAADTQTISFNGLSTVSVSGSLPPLQSGVKLIGSCNNVGPGITINGNGIAGPGLLLNNNQLYGLHILGFNGPILKVIQTHNILQCVVVGG